MPLFKKRQAFEGAGVVLFMEVPDAKKADGVLKDSGYAVRLIAPPPALRKESTICIGNGSNDASMLRESALGICVAGQEGASVETIMNSDLIVSNINGALDLLLKPDRLVATLRR